MKRKAPAQNKVRLRRTRTDIREALLESALVEFGAKGFDGASTRAIARRIGAHQPQINYYFASKEALWTAAVDHLFAQLHQAMDGLIDIDPSTVRIDDLALGFVETGCQRRRLPEVAAQPKNLQMVIGLDKVRKQVKTPVR